MTTKKTHRSANGSRSQSPSSVSRRDLLKGTMALGAAVAGETMWSGGIRSARAADPVTLNLLLWEHWKVADGLKRNDPSNVPRRRMWFYESIQRFEERNPHIKLEYQTANWNVATQTFIAGSQAGNPPDVLGAQSQDNQPLARAGYVADLDQFGYGQWDDFNQPILREACSVDGKIVAMPTYLTATGLGYNKAFLAEEGVTEPPKTWDELLRVGSQVTKDTRGTGRPNQWGFGVELSAAATPNPVAFTLPMIRSMGGAIVDDDDTGLMNTEAHRTIAKLLADMYNEHKILSPDSLTMKANDEVDFFSSGKWAMGIMIYALLPPTLENLGQENFGFAPYPTFPGDEPRSYSEVFNWLISAKAASDPAKAAAAWTLVEELGSSETLALCAKYQYGAPCRQSALELPIYESDPLLQYLSEYTLRTATPFPFINEVSLYAENYIEALNRIILLKQPVDEVLDAQQMRYERKVKP